MQSEPQPPRNGSCAFDELFFFLAHTVFCTSLLLMRMFRIHHGSGHSTSEALSISIPEIFDFRGKTGIFFFKAFSSKNLFTRTGNHSVPITALLLGILIDYAEPRKSRRRKRNKNRHFVLSQFSLIPLGLPRTHTDNMTAFN